VSQKKKPNKQKPGRKAGAAAAKRTRAPAAATTRSTAGPGFKFEDYVAAWLLTGMLTGQEVPGIRATGIRLQMQTSSLGWDVDDLLVTGAGSGPVHRLAISCKSSVQVTPSGLPLNFTRAAWREVRKEAAVGPDDAIALATRGHDAAFDQTWADIKGWCAGPSTELPLARINASTKHKRVFGRIKGASAQEVAEADDATVVRLIQRLEVLPFDFQLVPSHNESDAIERCGRLLRGGSGAEAKRLWEVLLRRAEKARLGDGTIGLDDLWRELSAHFDLEDHPNFVASWRVLSALSSDHVGTIDLELPSGFRAAHNEAADTLAARLQQGALAVVIGESGAGKSALVRTVLDEKFGGWQQVWLKPDVLEALLSESKRGQLGLTHALLDVLKFCSRPTNVLVIDSAERLSPDGAKRARKLIEELVGAASDACRVVVIGQADSVDSLQAIAGIAVPDAVEVGALPAPVVREALRSSPRLAWLASHNDAVAVLGNLQALAWVMQAENLFAQQGFAGAFSVTAVANRLWEHWTAKETRYQNLLIRLAVREASFERSFAIGELDIADAEAFDRRPVQLPLRRNARGRIEFQHDMAADWSRFQRLKEIADDTAQWAKLATNPLWNGALRMLGQYLLRQASGERTGWDDAFDKIEAGSLAQDVLLDALFLDPLAEQFLDQRAELLLANHGGLLNRLLRRFHHIATVPAASNPAVGIEPGLQFYIEAQYRTPLYGRWPGLAGFLAKHQDRVAGLMLPAVAKLCELWLTKTPEHLGNGVLTPYRREFADLALASAREMQLAQRKGTIFLDDSERPVYSAALAAAGVLPDEVSDWALEMVGLRPLREDLTERVAAHRREEAAKRAARTQSDAEFRTREERKRSLPVSLSSRQRLPPWPLGPKGRVEKDFRYTCLHTGALLHLMKVRPQIAAEVALAAIIEDDPEEPSQRLLEEELGLQFDSESYPTIYWKSPFFQFLFVNQEVALAALLQLVNFATERWGRLGGEQNGANALAGVVLTLTHGTSRMYVGNGAVFDWSHANSHSSGQLHCALAALEFWLRALAGNGTDIVPIVDRLLRESNSVGILGVLVNVGKYRPTLFAGPLRPLLASYELYVWDDHRMRALPYRFDAFNWVRAGEVVFEMAREWTLAEYRKVSLRKLVSDLVQANAKVAVHVATAAAGWKRPDDKKSALEQGILAAQLDARNYPAAADGSSRKTFQCPHDLQQDIDAFHEATEPILQTLTLAYHCDRVLLSPQPLSAEQCEALTAALEAVASDSASDEETRRGARLAAASTLMIKGSDWLKDHPQRRQEMEGLVREAVADIGETWQSLRGHTIAVGRGELAYVAQAVAHRWMAGGDAGREWEPLLLRVLTSRDRSAVATVMGIAYANRAQLGESWWRLLQLLQIWAGLCALGPNIDDPPYLDGLWNRWLRWLRRCRLDVAGLDVGVINPLEIAKRVERLHKDRWAREHRRKSAFRRPPAHRYSHGLDTHPLADAFVWLLNGTYADEEAEQARRIALELWAFEVWHTHEDCDEDEDQRLPSEFGYAVLDVLAGMVATNSAQQAEILWRPVFSLGPAGHHAIGHFLSCYFARVAKGADSAAFIKTWRAMLAFALGGNGWTGKRRWYDGERLLRQLLCFGADHALSGSFEGRPLLMHAQDFYQQWATDHLTVEEDNAAGLCGFLASDVGKPLRVEGLRWLATALGGDGGLRWHRDRTGHVLVEFLDVFLTADAERALRDPETRDALLQLAALLVARQVPNGLALQERVQKLR